MSPCRTMPERVCQMAITPLAVPILDLFPGLPEQRGHACWRRFACHGSGCQPLSIFAAGGVGIIANSTSLALTADASAIVRGD